MMVGIINWNINIWLSICCFSLDCVISQQRRVWKKATRKNNKIVYHLLWTAFLHCYTLLTYEILITLACCILVFQTCRSFSNFIFNSLLINVLFENLEFFILLLWSAFSCLWPSTWRSLLLPLRAVAFNLFSKHFQTVSKYTYLDQ